MCPERSERRSERSVGPTRPRSGPRSAGWVLGAVFLGELVNCPSQGWRGLFLPIILKTHLYASFLASISSTNTITVSSDIL